MAGGGAWKDPRPSGRRGGGAGVSYGLLLRPCLPPVSARSQSHSSLPGRQLRDPGGHAETRGREPLSPGADAGPREFGADEHSVLFSPEGPFSFAD